jgi:hypothetical protein
VASEHGETGAHGTNGAAAPSSSDLRSQILAEAAELSKGGAARGQASAVGDPVETEDDDETEVVEAAAHDAEPEDEDRRRG